MRSTANILNVLAWLVLLTGGAIAIFFLVGLITGVSQIVLVELFSQYRSIVSSASQGLDLSSDDISAITNQTIQIVLSSLSVILVASAAYIFVYRPQVENFHLSQQAQRLELIQKLETELDALFEANSIFLRRPELGHTVHKIYPVLPGYVVWLPQIPNRGWNSEFGTMTTKFLQQDAVMGGSKISIDAEISSGTLHAYLRIIKRMVRGVNDGLLSDDDILMFWRQASVFFYVNRYKFMLSVFNEDARDMSVLYAAMAKAAFAQRYDLFFRNMALNGDEYLVSQLDPQLRKKVTDRLDTVRQRMKSEGFIPKEFHFQPS